MDEELTDGEVLDLVYDWVENLTEYEILTNPILNELLLILKDYEEDNYDNK